MYKCLLMQWNAVEKSFRNVVLAAPNAQYAERFVNGTLRVMDPLAYNVTKEE